MGKKEKALKTGIKRETASATASVRDLWRDWLLFAIVALLVAYPLFFRGLFFPRAMFTAHIITAVVFIGFWVMKWRRGDLRLIRSPLDWAALAFAVAYALSLITAVHFGDALYGSLQAFNYFMIYWLGGQVITDHLRL
ncbi:MAG TPA: hypothetical protein DER60_12775, partial [Syntrophomonas sp.]|nr:hypothetical protein [Syntrophomonas sp.]